MSIVVDQIVQLKPCMVHTTRHRHEPPCCQNYGGDYQVIRQLPWDRVMLRHIPSMNLALVSQDAIMPVA